MRRFGLIGYPLGHSFSRKYFSDKFANEGITGCEYQLFPIENIELLPGLLENYPDLEGLNVTIPYKKDVLAYLTDTSKLPAGLNACNCIRIKDGQLTGFNTDVTGFRLSISGMLKPHHKHALILGNGGATAAVKYALGELGLHYSVVSRRRSVDVDLIYEEIDEAIMSKYSVIINTTPLGTIPDVHLAPEIPYDLLAPDHLLYDLVYNPEVTTFMKQGQLRGASVKNGYDMLVIQAEESWKIWNS
ncbi:shikimate dehydrogenase family protein [Flavitalea antarctica]